MTIHRFVESLACATLPPGLRNPYRHAEALGNLTVFLSRRSRQERCLLLVGEAPGYRGAAVTGVPFTSLALLTEDWGDPWKAFGPASGYIAPPGRYPAREATATVVWTALSRQYAGRPLPLTWNAAPFHPFGATAQSNRPLHSGELRIGLPWLARILDLFPESVPVAAGRRASESLGLLGVPHEAIRHPSHGGASEFAEGLKAAFAR